MTNFLGVISNSAKSSSSQQVLEFSDLELLSDCLFNETQNLYVEFLQKLKFINDREITIHENSKRLAHVYQYLLTISSKMLVMERETDTIENCLSQVESLICHMQINAQGYACKCTSNKERDGILYLLVKLSEDIYRMEYQMEETKEQECLLSMENLCCWTHRFIPFLDLYNTILLQIESKLSRISDTLKDLEEKFFHVNKRHMCAHFHKIKHHYISDC